MTNKNTQTLSLSKETHSDKLKEKIIKSANDLPPMPKVAQKARQVISDPKSTFKELATIIESDPAIATRVLKMANSTYYGFSGKVSSIKQAGIVLGIKALMDILNLACAQGILNRTLKGYDLDSGELWIHSLAVATGSQIIAKKIRNDASFIQDAFSAGLIHDVGKIILSPYIFERQKQFQDYLRLNKTTFLKAEKDILGFDHAEIASGVCEKWKIPPNLINAIRFHHLPSESGKNELAYIIHIANCIAQMSGIGSGIDGMLYQAVEDNALDFLEINPSDMGNIVSEIEEFVEKTMVKL